MTKTSSNAKNKLGKLIVIDGTDGTGKTTQTSLLIKHLRQTKKNVALSDFPRYGLPSAYFVEKYLNGHYGSSMEVSPYTASLFFALDRYDAKPNILKNLTQGKIIISNRYVTANMGHQGGKIKSLTSQKEYFKWIDWLEHEQLKIPRPNCTIILHIPAYIAQRLIDRKGRRDYIRGKRDMHEADLSHLKAAEKTFLIMAKLFPNFYVVECMAKGKLLSPDEIHEKVWKIVKKII